MEEDKLKRGDIILIRSWFFKPKSVVVNYIFGNDYILVDSYLWQDISNMNKWCRLVHKNKILSN